MRALTLASVALTIAMATATIKPPPYDLSKADSLFEQFIKDYNRHYKDQADRTLHFNAFIENLAMINLQNREQPSATFAIDKFADYTGKEWRAMNGFKKN